MPHQYGEALVWADMKNPSGKPSISTLLPFRMAVVAIVSIVLLGGLWLYNESRHIQMEADTLEEIYITEKKNHLEHVVQHAVSHVHFMQENSEGNAADIKDRVLAELAEKSNDMFQEMGGYIFVGQWDGLSLNGPAVGCNMLDVTDVNGVKIVQELIAAAKSGGGYVSYVIPEFNGNRSGLKMSYVEAIPEWEWYIGHGVFMDELEQITAKVQGRARDEIISNSLIVTGLLIVLSLVATLTARRIARISRDGFDALISFFGSAANESAAIDLSKLAFSEFEEIAHSANRMIEALKKIEAQDDGHASELKLKNKMLEAEIAQRREAEKELQEHRAHLQDLVEDRTQELSQAKEDAETANLIKTRFLANMSHELRTPLNAIIGYSDSILHETFGPMENNNYKEYISDIHASGIHLLELISDILDISAIEAGKMEITLDSIDLDHVSDFCVQLVEAQAEKGELTISRHIPDDLPAFTSDDRRLKQILVNLLSNAVKFTPSGGKISISAKQESADQLSITVEDNGIGMSQDEMELALSEFGQVNNAFVQTIQGTGLGLPLTRHLIELLGGSFHIKSVSGEGTRVSIHLPL